MNNELKQKVAVGLVRVSSHSQESNTSLQFQEEKILQYCKLHELQLSKVVGEVCSGSIETRDSIEEVKDLVKNNKVGVVVIWKSDRCFRSMLHFSRFYEFLKKHNVEPVYVPWRHRYFWDGGLHCITLDLYREGTQKDYFG